MIRKEYYVRVEHVESVHPLAQVQTPGLVHVPPLLHPDAQMAKNEIKI
jgi:hypothetical protein